MYVAQNFVRRERFAHENFSLRFAREKKTFFISGTLSREYGKLPKMFVVVFINTVAVFLIKINETDAFRFRVH